ncbi:hypothetical protein ACI3ET_01135 [Ornithinimicrobium sp. LYQ121]|uniref:hypothetical protein n=1 Tax=Ornithinimicrobium sp. LYQ121 TaxID=3378801 RepID=UPI0038552E42
MVGEVFDRELVLRENCDDSAKDCTVSHESLALYYPQDVESTWTLEREPDRWTATFEEAVEDDCVDEDENVVGTFDTDVSYEMTLTEPETVDGTLSWTRITVRYVEDAVSADTDEGCYTSRYVAEGALERTDP